MGTMIPASVPFIATDASARMPIFFIKIYKKAKYI
jgi:hypothetical protein